MKIYVLIIVLVILSFNLPTSKAINEWKVHSNKIAILEWEICSATGYKKENNEVFMTTECTNSSTINSLKIRGVDFDTFKWISKYKILKIMDYNPKIFNENQFTAKDKNYYYIDHYIISKTDKTNFTQTKWNLYEDKGNLFMKNRMEGLMFETPFDTFSFLANKDNDFKLSSFNNIYSFKSKKNIIFIEDNSSPRGLNKYNITFLKWIDSKSFSHISAFFITDKNNIYYTKSTFNKKNTNSIWYPSESVSLYSMPIKIRNKVDNLIKTIDMKKVWDNKINELIHYIQNATNPYNYKITLEYNRIYDENFQNWLNSKESSNFKAFEVLKQYLIFKLESIK